MEQTLEKLNKAALQFLAPLSLEETYEKIVTEAIKLTKADEGAILLAYDDELKVVYGSSDTIRHIVPRKNGFAYTAYKKRQAFVVQRSALQKYTPDISHSDSASMLFLPLSYKKQSIGALVLRSKTKRNFSKEQLRVLRLFGSFASMAIKKTHLYAEASSALEVRDAFISLASHELRTPLTSINGYIQLLLSKLGKDSTHSNWVHELHRESIRLTSLIKDMLEISRMRSGRMQFAFESMAIEDVLNNAVKLYTDTHRDPEITIQNVLPSDKRYIVADNEKLTSVFSALFESLTKISPSKNPAFVIHLFYDKPYITIHIHDSISTTAKAELERLFKGNTYKEGMGLGLVLAQHILAQHQAEMNIVTARGKTVVEIKLPELSLS